ncbi:hypothetical protein [Allosphingosinicella sp.]|uniref:hypothetical protein n=1 Tax=Allosphingosinicella sp. TaxID=2823234 RepID=UPI0037843E9A
MTMYRALLGIDLIAAATLLLFFLWGVSDGTALYAPGLWLGTLALAAGTIGGAVALRRSGKTGLATLLLLPVAIPATGYGLFVLSMLILQPRWN